MQELHYQEDNMRTSHGIDSSYCDMWFPILGSLRITFCAAKQGLILVSAVWLVCLYRKSKT